MNQMSDINLPTNDVRPIERADPVTLNAMLRLFKQGQAPHHRDFPDHFGPGENEAEIRTFLGGFFKPRNPFRTRSGYALGWLVDAKLSGYLLYRLSESSNVYFGKSRWNCFIEDIVVDEAARGLGGGSALMERVLTIANALPNCAISGTVWGGNEASAALFEKHGLAPLSRSFQKVYK